MSTYLRTCASKGNVSGDLDSIARVLDVPVDHRKHPKLVHATTQAQLIDE